MKFMYLKIKEIPLGERPVIIPLNPKILDLLGEEGIRKLVSDHYDALVDSAIKDMFPPKGVVLELAKKHSADFFIQHLGGPKYFNNTRGRPMLATRHNPFKITPQGRVEWLKIYQKLLPKLNMPKDLLDNYWTYLHDFSNWMVNTPE